MAQKKNGSFCIRRREEVSRALKYIRPLGAGLSRIAYLRVFGCSR